MGIGRPGVAIVAGVAVSVAALMAAPVARVSASDPPEADLSLVMTVDNGLPFVGQVVTITLTVANDGPDQATSVHVTDLLPVGLGYVSDNGAGDYDTSTGVWAVGTLDVGGPGSTAALEITATVTGTTPVDNVAEVTASDQVDPDSTPSNASTTEDDDDSITITGQPSADVSLTKTVDRANPVTGEQVTFTLTVTNSGSEDASVVRVTDLLPGGLVYESNSAGSYNRFTGVWDASPLVAGDVRTLNIVATVTSVTPVDNYAEVTAVTAGAPDPDSSPDNTSTSEDDDAIATVTPATPFGSIVVNSTADPGDGVANAAETTLREALALVDSDGSLDRIHFDIGPGATATVTLDAASGPLETIDQAIIIDGTTEGPGASGRVAIDGSSLTSGNGLTIERGISTIRGLAIIGFPGHGIAIRSNGSNVIAGNYIGLGLDGVTAAGNLGDGINVSDTLGNPTGSVNNVIGGVHAWDRNVISANGMNGINLQGDGWNVVRGNYVGLDASGGEARANAADGILIRSNRNDVGGAEGFEDCRPCNVISGNGAAGISLAGSDNLIHGNFIGTDASGEGDVPNQDGIVVGSGTLTTTGTIIGIGPPGEARNVISGNARHGIVVIGTNTTATLIRANYIGATDFGFPGNNGGDGVRVVGATDTLIDGNLIMQSGGDGVAVLGPGSPDVVIRGYNLIWSNGDLGIDLAADGVTANDPDANNDADVGPDGLQNFPDLVSAIATNRPTQPGNTITVEFSLQTTADTAGIVVDFFESTTCNPGGPASPPFGEGFTNIGSLTVDTDEDGSYPPDGTQTAVFSRYVPPGFVITAIATGPDGTSEFSHCVTVEEATTDLELTKTVDHSTPPVGSTVAFTLTATNHGPDAATGVTVTDLLPAGLTFVSANPAPAYDATTGVWTVGSLASGASVDLRILATVTGTTPVDNTASVTADFQTDPNPGNNSATVAVTGQPTGADLSLIKTVDDPRPVVGTNVTFTVAVTNAGPELATGVTVTDLLPTGLTLVSFESGDPARPYDVGTGLWTVGDVASGATVELEIVARVTGTAPVRNIAEVTAADQADPDSTPGNGGTTHEDDDSSVTVTGRLVADLSLDMTVNDPTPPIGTSVHLHC